MNSVILLIVITLCLTTNNYTDCLYARIGKSVYTSENNYDECGFTDVIKIFNISYEHSKCFGNPYPNQIHYYLIQTENKSTGESPPQSRVSWGRPALWAEAPWAVHLLFQLPLGVGLSYETCSGSLINLEWVLTAAHCFIDQPKSWETIVSAGDPNMNTPHVREGWLHIVHPKYRIANRNDDNSYDIGLIKLLSPFTREIYRRKNRFKINPICLPESRSTLNEHRENATLYGFGIGKFVEKNSLQRADLTLEVNPLVELTTNNSNCQFNLYTLCARVSGRETKLCKGDSGAGLIQWDEKRNAYVVIGVASSYFPGDDKNGINFMCFDESKTPYFNYFAPVPRVVDWIIEQITENINN